MAQGDLPWRVLRYQRILDPDKTTYPVAKLSYTRPPSFERHLKYLSKECRVITLDELARKIRAKEEIPDKTVAVTFDGGWIDNFVYAYPLLLRYNIPATFCLPTAFIGSQNFFWQDKILFAMVILRQAGVAFQLFDFFSEPERELLLDISPNGEISYKLIFALVALLLMHPAQDRVLALTVLGSVAQQLGGDLPVEPAFMSWEDVELMRSPLVTFATLGQGNTPYTELTPDAAQKDIESSLATLRKHTDRVSKLFAFPEGLIPAKHFPMLQRIGIDSVLGILDVPKLSKQLGDPLMLPRLPIFEGDNATTDVFAYNLWLKGSGEK